MFGITGILNESLTLGSEPSTESLERLWVQQSRPSSPADTHSPRLAGMEQEVRRRLIKVVVDVVNPADGEHKYFQVGRMLLTISFGA